MKFGHFILDNLTSVWQNNSPVSRVFNGLFKSGIEAMQENSAFDNLIAQEAHIKAPQDLDKLEENLRTATIKNRISNLRSSGWQLDSVTISDRASLLQQTDKAMADALKNGTDAASGVNNETTYGKKLVGVESEHPLAKYMPKPNNISREIIGEDFTLNTGIKVFEFQGTSAQAQEILAAKRKNSFAITNTAKAKTNSLENLKKGIAINGKLSPDVTAKATGAFALFDKVNYKYSYDKNPQTNDLTKLDLERKETGASFIAKKLEVRNQLIDLRGAEYFYADVKNKNTNQPYRIFDTNSELNAFNGNDPMNIMRELVASKNSAGGIDDLALADQEIGEFLKKAGAKPGIFSIIDSKGQVHTFILTEDYKLMSEEAFVFAQMNEEEQKEYLAGNKEVFNQKLKALRESDEINFKV